MADNYIYAELSGDWRYIGKGEDSVIATKDYVNTAILQAQYTAGEGILIANRNISVNTDYISTVSYVDNHHDSTKQDVIDDLETIRTGASLGATALQSVPDYYATQNYVDTRFIVTSVIIDDEIEE